MEFTSPRLPSTALPPSSPQSECPPAPRMACTPTFPGPPSSLLDDDFDVEFARWDVQEDQYSLYHTDGNVLGLWMNEEEVLPSAMRTWEHAVSPTETRFGYRSYSYENDLSELPDLIRRQSDSTSSVSSEDYSPTPAMRAAPFPSSSSSKHCFERDNVQNFEEEDIPAYNHSDYHTHFAMAPPSRTHTPLSWRMHRSQSINNNHSNMSSRSSTPSFRSLTPVGWSPHGFDIWPLSDESQAFQQFQTNLQASLSNPMTASSICKDKSRRTESPVPSQSKRRRVEARGRQRNRGARVIEGQLFESEGTSYTSCT